ncbi:MAG: glycosyltransferase, partial [Burkholderiales bacterium]|nr:glycosyltransferase [Anaerolineae bacterium]
MITYLPMSGKKQRTAVIICAYTEDRWHELVAAVESVQGQGQPPDEIVIVIDHNLVLLARVRERFADLTIIENPDAKGLSNARNAGIAATKANLLAFLDDDAVAHPDWLKLMLEAIEPPTIVGVGGRVLPQWVDRQPQWLPEEFYWVVGCTHRGVPTQTAEIRNPIGASMLIRREVFDLAGGFNSSIGRVGTLPVGCEETELAIRARQQIRGAKFMYVPDALVEHKVPAQRTTWRYFMSRCYAEGLSKALVSQLVGRGDGLSAERAHAFKTLPRAFFGALGQGNRQGITKAVAIVAGLTMTTAGYVRGLIAQRKQSAANTSTELAPMVDAQQSMRVLMVSARYFPLTGGTETHTYEVARRMAADGHQVTVLTTDLSGELAPQEIHAGVTIKRVAAYPRSRDFYFAPAIYSEITSGKWDVVHIQGYHTFVAPIAMFAAWRS